MLITQITLLPLSITPLSPPLISPLSSAADFSLSSSFDAAMPPAITRRHSPLRLFAILPALTPLLAAFAITFHFAITPLISPCHYAVIAFRAPLLIITLAMLMPLLLPLRRRLLLRHTRGRHATLIDVITLYACLFRHDIVAFR